MASRMANFTILLMAIFAVATANYVEALAAEAFDPALSRVELKVALRDGYYSKYVDIISGLWITDTSAVYTADKTHILNYCKKKYPQSEITNIVDSSNPVVIDQWCPVTGEECTSSAETTYYRCLVGPFESDALMVYNVCKFFHKHDENICREPNYWKGVAKKDCGTKKMALNGTGMLLPCTPNVDVFKGVEYTCCPPPKNVPPRVEVEDAREEEEEDDEEEEEEEEAGPERDNVAPRPQIGNALLDDPYFRATGLSGATEKAAFADAKTRLAANQKKEMARVMQQWQEAQEHYEQLKKKDKKAAEKMRKEMTARFEETIGAIEVEEAEEKQELREAHQVRIESRLRKKINDSLPGFKAALRITKSKPRERKVIHTLRRYLHDVKKLRQHYIEHYKHLQQTDPLQAEEHRHYILSKLRALDLEVADTIELLSDLPDVYADLKPKVDALLSSIQASPEDAALINRMQEDEDVIVVLEPTFPQPTPEEDDQPTETEQEEDVPENAEEIVETPEETPEKELPVPKTKPIPETKPVTSTSSSTQTRPDPPTPPQQPEVDEGAPVEIGEAPVEIEVPPVPQKSQVVAVKPIDTYLDEDMAPAIEAEVQPPMVPIVARKPMAKVQKSAAAARVETQKLVNRQGVDSLDNSVSKKKMQLHSEPMMAFGLACGVLAVATVLVIAVLVVRRKTSRRTPVNNGFTEIDPNMTVEQRHIVAMQSNGYENPTYKYFDMQ